MRAKLPKAVVLRWGHRPRDERLTTHVALTARAFGASGIILTDIKDEKIKETIDKVVKNWGGSFFFEMGTPWKTAMKKWRAKGSVVVHLTAYGENIQTSNVIQRIQATGKDVLIVVGSRKVPSEFFSPKVSDFNIAVGNQHHSECSSLAVFLDRFFGGGELAGEFKNPLLAIVPQRNGKKVVSKRKV